MTDNRSGRKRCWLCGKNGAEDPLDLHHVFMDEYKKKSEKYGLLIPLCHSECHIFGKNAVHHNAKTMLMVRQWGQRKVMEEQGWTVQRFIEEFGKNYLDDEE